MEQCSEAGSFIAAREVWSLLFSQLLFQILGKSGRTRIFIFSHIVFRINQMHEYMCTMLLTHEHMCPMILFVTT